MSEYEHLKKQKDEMLAKHREPGTKCPFGCPHESEARLRAELEAAKKEMEAKREGMIEWRMEYENACKFANQYEQERDSARALLAASEASRDGWKTEAIKRANERDEAVLHLDSRTLSYEASRMEVEQLEAKLAASQARVVELEGALRTVKDAMEIDYSDGRCDHNWSGPCGCFRDEMPDFDKYLSLAPSAAPEPKPCGGSEGVAHCGECEKRFMRFCADNPPTPQADKLCESCGLPGPLSGHRLQCICTPTPQDEKPQREKL